MLLTYFNNFQIFVEIFIIFYFILDNGHSHRVNLETSFSGDHAHVYKDIWFSEHTVRLGGWTDYTGLPYAVGSSDRPDYDNVGYQFSRNTFNSGNHNHKFDGNSHTSNSILTGTGGDQSLDMRQPFTIVQYIIYIQN
jgi:hypothetical protein